MEATNFTLTTKTKTFYKIAGALAILIILAGLTDALSSMGISAQDNRAIPAAQWFSLFQTHRFEAFSRLGLINIITLTLSIPIYAALAQVFRKEHPVLAVFAPIVFIIGAVVYFSSNTVFAMFGVSQQYASASSTQKPLLEAAGQALLAQGADLSTGTFMGLCFTQLAGLLLTGAMTQGKVFGRWMGWIGFAGYSIMTVFFILTAFYPASYSTAMQVAAPGALIMIVYQILLARKFLQLGTAEGGVR